MTTPQQTKRPSPPVLGASVEDVMDAWRQHPGELDMKPFAFDVHTGFTVFLDAQGQMQRKEPGVAIPLTPAECDAFLADLAAGAVDIYLQRPSAGVRTDLVRPKKQLHRATLKPIPVR